MTTNASITKNGKGVECNHNPPVNLADLRVRSYTNSFGFTMYDLLGGDVADHPACLVSYENYGKDFAFGLGSYLMSRGKNITYAKFSLGKEPPLGPLNGNPFELSDLKGRKMIVTSDCLTPEEREMVDRRLGELRGELGFEDVAYALEKE